MNVSLASPMAVAALALPGLVLAFLAGELRGRGLLRPIAAVGAVVLVLVAAADGVNTYFDYIPTTAALLGRRACDQASPAKLREAVARAGPALPVQRRGLVESVDIPGAISGFRARRAQVYLPPAWFTSPRPALPVVLLLHGTPGSPADWTRAGFADVTADRWAEAHAGRAPILLMVDENGGFTRDTECVDGTGGRAETYLVQDVPRWAVATLGARADRAGWAVAGSSEGGYCALVLGLRHPDRFAAFADFSGLDRPTHRGGPARLFRRVRRDLPRYLPANLLARRPPTRPAAWFEVGAADGRTTRAVLRVASLARAAGVPVRVVVVAHAHHTWRVWRHALRDAFPWLATTLGAA